MINLRRNDNNENDDNDNENIFGQSSMVVIVKFSFQNLVSGKLKHTVSLKRLIHHKITASQH